MNCRKACFLSGAFLLGIATAEFSRRIFWVLLILYGMAWAHSIWRQADTPARVKIFWILAFWTLAACGHYDSKSQAAFRDAYESELEDGAECLVQGEIYHKETDGKTGLFYLKNCRMQLHQKNYLCNHILLNLNAMSYSIGEILFVKGTIQTFSLPVNEGNYNERAYYQSLKIDFKVEGNGVIAVSGRKGAVREGLWALREKIKEGYQNAMPEKDAGVLIAMVLGDKSQMDAERKSLYQDMGISHFYSISGLHISLLGMALYHLLRKRGGNYLLSGGVAAALILGYGEMIGFGVSASRAIGMFLLLMYAKCRGRSYDRATALALLAAVLAGANPGLTRHAGYLLSFSAVLGVMMAEWLTEAGNSEKGEEETERKSSLWEKIRQALTMSACIQLATIPVMCQFFYEISVYAAFLNLLVLPCMGILLGLGMVGGIFCCIWPFAGKLLLYPCYLILLLFERACLVFLRLPHASLITGTMSLSAMLLWYIALALLLAAKRCGKRLPALALAVLFSFLLLVKGTPGFELDFLDVGQGDGIFLAAGDGTAMFIDGGSSDIGKVGTYRILPFLKRKGIRQIDYWFVSHCDADHVSGLREALEADYPVRHLAVSQYMPDDGAWQELKELARQRQIPVLAMGKGDALHGARRDWSVTCLSYEGQGRPDDRNENSLVLFFESEDLTALFAGDIGQEQERALATEWVLPGVDVYKASHHGSNYSNCEELLDCLKPEMTVISCSMKNRYGHPGAEALARIQKTGGKIYETRRLGQIKIKEASLEAEGFSVLK